MPCQIARALPVDPCLLILDESTSAVDTKIEAAIREALAGRGRAAPVRAAEVRAT